MLARKLQDWLHQLLQLVEFKKYNMNSYFPCDNFDALKADAITFQFATCTLSALTQFAIQMKKEGQRKKKTEKNTFAATRRDLLIFC